jgi:CheY-like chemotaxis protein
VDNGQKAVDKVLLEADRISVILMDVQMPVLDGYEATRQIRAWEALEGRQALPIVAVTADAFVEDQTRCRDAGMDEFLAKPIKLAALADVLHRCHAPSPVQETRL